MSFDPALFGHRLRHYRRLRNLTLEQLGDLIDRPAPYLSLLENGKREPKLSQIGVIAEALGVTTDDLLTLEAPNRRAELELALEQMKSDPRYEALGLGELKASARVPDEALEHVVGLFNALARDEGGSSVDTVRQAAAEVSRWMTEHDGYLAHVEQAAARTLSASGHDGQGALTSRHLNTIVDRLGYKINAVDDAPSNIRSIVDEDRQTIFLGQRNSLRTRQARKVILQTVAVKVLGHSPPRSVFDQQRQRLEEAYFAAAVLIPERAAVAALRSAKNERDLTVEDIKERFYVSYEMAAQRFTNLATRHLEIATHFAHSDADGIVWKAYQNDGFPLPTIEGAYEGRRLCRWFGGRTVYTSADRFDVHYQFTDTPAGSFWSATHLTPDTSARALTTGVQYADARWFRGRRAPHQEQSRCPDEKCCRTPDGKSRDVWAGHRLQAHLVTILSGDTPPDQAELIEFVDRHPDEYMTSEASELGYPDPWATTEEELK